MNSKQLKDYLHLYGIDIEVNTVDGIGSVIGIHPKGATVSLKSVGLKQELHGFDKGNGGLHRIYLFKDNYMQLALRPLSDLTDDEYGLAGDEPQTVFEAAEQTKYLLSIGIDLFGLIESGLAIDKTQIK